MLKTNLDAHRDRTLGFMYEQIAGDKRYRLLKVIDDSNREGMGIEVDFSLPAKRVISDIVCKSTDKLT